MSNNRVYLAIWESSENQLDGFKKSLQNFWKFFENPPPPHREKPRPAPAQDFQDTNYVYP